MKTIKSLNPIRLVIYLLGLVILAAGITLNTKSGMGVSPIISIPFVVSIKTGIPLGTLTFYYYILMVLIQIALLRRNFPPVQFLQIGCCYLTSAFIGLFDRLFLPAQGLPAQLLVLFIAIFLTSVGISLTIGMKIVPNPADGLTDVFARTIKKELGFAKNLFDFICIGTTLVLSFTLLGRLEAIGFGTVMTMIFTGRFVALEKGATKKLVDWVFKMS